MVVVNVPFSDQSGSKPRPALIVSSESFHRRLLDVIVAPLSSQPRYYQKPGSGDHPLKHWDTVGLRHPSTVRLSNLLAIEKRLIKRVLGALHSDDLRQVESGLRSAFGL